MGLFVGMPLADFKHSLIRIVEGLTGSVYMNHAFILDVQFVYEIYEICLLFWWLGKGFTLPRITRTRVVRIFTLSGEKTIHLKTCDEYSATHFFSSWVGALH